jgi:hypothetical protein
MVISIHQSPDPPVREGGGWNIGGAAVRQG